MPSFSSWRCAGGKAAGTPANLDNTPGNSQKDNNFWSQKNSLRATLLDKCIGLSRTIHAGLRADALRDGWIVHAGDSEFAELTYCATIPACVYLGECSADKILALSSIAR